MGQQETSLFAYQMAYRSTSPRRAPPPQPPSNTPPRGTKRPAPPNDNDQGTKFMSEKNYQDAIDYYTTNLETDSDAKKPWTYSHRALARLRLEQFNDAITDCEQALEMMPNLAEAHFVLGEAFCELGQLDEGLGHLERSIQIVKEQGLSVLENTSFDFVWIQSVTQFWRKRACIVREEKRREDLSQIIVLIKENEVRKISEIRASSIVVCKEVAAGDGYHHDIDGVAEGPLDEDQDAKISEVIQEGVKHISVLNDLYDTGNQKIREQKVPDCLCGKISLDLMHDPVITPCGITYERALIEEHLHKVGHFDPTTRRTLIPEQLVPNLALKEVIDEFKKKNGWAVDLNNMKAELSFSQAKFVFVTFFLALSGSMNYSATFFIQKNDQKVEEDSHFSYCEKSISVTILAVTN